MPSKKKPETAELNVPKELLDQLVKGPMTQGDLETMFRSLFAILYGDRFTSSRI